MEDPSDGPSINVGPTSPEVAHGPILLPLLLTNQSFNDQYLGSSAPSGPTPGTTIVDEAVAELTDFSDEGMESFQSVKSTQGGGETTEEGMDHDVPQAARGALTLLLTNQNNNANNANQPMNGTTVVYESVAELTDLSEEGIEPPSSMECTQYAEEGTDVGEQNANSHGVSGAPILLTLLLTNQNNNANGQGTAVPGSGTTVVHEHFAELVDIRGKGYDLLHWYHSNHLTRPQLARLHLFKCS
ncbi:MAG: hypothetical protein Q9195_002559 [Heterodermia aff. obscurata]